MKDYRRLTKWSELGTLHVFDINGKEVPLCDVSPIDTDNLAGRLAYLEDKIEDGTLVEVPKEVVVYTPGVVLTPEEREEEMRFANEERKQAVKEFAEKLRDKEFSVKIGSEWCAVVKSRDIDEFVKEGGVRVMKQIDGEYLVKLQAATIRKFAAEDSDYPDCRAIRANERAIQKWLDKITDNADEQRRILDVIERGNWNMEDTTFKPIFDELRALGYEVVFERSQK